MATLGVISLTVPAMLGGLALLSLPLLAHLLNRRAKRRIVFPSIELLAASSASHASLFRLRRWLLLALRCLAVALLVLAFAQPLWVSSPAEAEDPEAGAHVVLLVDVSASAGQSIGGVTALDTLRPAADRVLDGLSVGVDRANIVVGSARPHTVFPQMTANLDAVRGELAKLQPTPQRMNLAAALGLAGEALGEADGKRHLVILTDLQSTNWKPQIDRLIYGDASIANPLPSDTQVTLVPVESPLPDNVGLSHARSLPPRPIAGRPSRLSVRVTNHAAFVQRPEVRLYLDDNLVATSTPDLRPGEAGEVSFEVKLEEARDYQARFVIGSDALEPDNAAYVAVRAVDRQPALIITDSDPQQIGSAAYFLLRALSPRGNEADSYETRLVRSTAIDAAGLQDTGVVLIAEAGVLDIRTVELLRDFVIDGGSLLYLGGAGAVSTNLKAIDGSHEGGLSPWTLGARQDLARHGRVASITDGHWRSPELRVFDATGRDALARMTFDRVWPVSQLAPEAEVLLRYADGSPAMAARAVGAGQVVATTFGVGSGDGSLSKHGTFVAFVQHLTQTLQPTAMAARGITVPQSVAYTPARPPAADGGAIVVVGPDRQPIADARVAAEGTRAIITLDSVAEAGFYAVLQDDQILGQFAANVDARESDLARLDPAAVTEALTAVGVNAAAQRAADTDAGLSLRGTPLWGWMLVGTMFALALELLLLGASRR